MERWRRERRGGDVEEWRGIVLIFAAVGENVGMWEVFIIVLK